jgi:hypothetical protein
MAEGHADAVKLHPFRIVVASASVGDVSGALASVMCLALVWRPYGATTGVGAELTSPSGFAAVHLRASAPREIVLGAKQAPCSPLSSSASSTSVMSTAPRPRPE